LLPDALVEASLSLSELASSEFDSVADITIPDILSVFTSDGSDPGSFQLVSMDVSITTSLTSVQSYRNAREFSEDDVDSELPISSSSDEDSVRQPVAAPPVHISKVFDLPLDIDPKYVPRLPRLLSEHVKLGVLGKVSSVIKGCVVIASLPNLSPLDKGSALYLQNRRPLGEVYDTIGPVRSPFYVVVHENRQPPSRPLKARSERTTVNDTTASTTVTCSAAAMTEARSAQDLPKLSVEVSVGDEVFYVLDDPALSIKILCSELSKLRGSDASGLKDEEISPDQQDFSDDEKEYAHRRKLEGKRSNCANRRGWGGSGFNNGRSNHLSRQGAFRSGVGVVSRPRGGVGGCVPSAGLRNAYSSGRPITYQQSLPPSTQRGVLRPSLLGSHQTISRQSMQFIQHQPISFASWNVAPMSYAYCGPQITGWEFTNRSYFPQHSAIPLGVSPLNLRQTAVQGSHRAIYEGNFDGVVDPTPLPAFTTGTPPHQEDPPAF
uniref:H/ACA ribonucleoprotein complex non-core subunit NAF1 n=1 Tax=Hydatigena taeniaeformis TaxID=6205 RepID=A0A0R3WMA2_HYDTA